MQSVRPCAVALSVLGLALLSCTNSSSSSPEEDEVVQSAQPLTYQESVLNFESLSNGNWLANGATLSLDDKRTEGQHALKFTTTASSFNITSAKLAAQAAVTDRLWIDLYIPASNYGWYGGMNVFASAPSINAYNVWIGYVSFDYFSKDKYVRTSFELQGYPKYVLGNAVNDLTISLQGSAPVGQFIYLDRIYIGQSTSAVSIPSEASVQLDLPAGLGMSNVCLHAASTLRVNDRATVVTPNGGFATISNSGSGDTILGVYSQTGTVYSVPSVTLRSNATVNGSVLTTGTVNPQDTTSSVKGIREQGVELTPLNTIKWTQAIPVESLPGYSLEPNDKRSTPISAGRYGTINLKDGSKLTIGTGTYIFDQLILNSKSELSIENGGNSATIVYVLDTVILRGAVTLQADTANVMFVALGAMPIGIETNLSATFVAPNADVNVSPDKATKGAIFAKSVEVHQGSQTTFRPFTRGDCPTNLSTCSTAPGCPNPDADNDGLTDCEEKTDGDFWTDPSVFNGAKFNLYAPCHPAGPANSLIDTPAEIQSCLAGSVLATANQYSGWHWPQPATPSSCEVGLGFSTPWTTCRNDWQIYAEASIRVEQSSRHCFALKGDTTNAAGALLVDGAGSVATIGGSAICVQLPAGIHKVNWLYERTGPTKQPFGILYCQGNTADCTPTTPLTQRALRPEHASSDPVCDSPSRDCSELCPCTAGNGTCSSSAQCQAGFACGTANGSYFGQAAAANVCWLSSCETEFTQATCSRVQVQCQGGSDCGLGEVCGAANGSQFDNLYGRVCWPAQCETEPTVFGCGSLQSPCGRCPCVPNCGSKLCGDSLDDGCGGTCKGFCNDGGLGCKQNTECKAGSTCDLIAGIYFGGDPGDSVCWPETCATTPAETRDCGTPTSACGSTCETCTPECGTRECGIDPKCGQSCGVCGSGQFCNGSGKCEAASVDPILLGVPKDVVTPSAAGTLGGALSVTPGGQAHYSIPLILPPGVGGHVPNLSLEYDSGWGPGMWGLGWRLGGLSSIQRCPRTYSQGAAAPVKYDDTDQFCLDGVPLVQVGEVDGVKQYRTEVESFARISAMTTAPQTATYYGFIETSTSGPASFEVELPNGNVVTYGASSTMVVVHSPQIAITGVSANSFGVRTAWQVTGIVDRHGNSIEFVYDSTFGCQPGGLQAPIGVTGDRVNSLLCYSDRLLKTINYGGNESASIAHNRTIEFNYENLEEVGLKKLVRTSWNAGIPRRLDKRYTKITTKFEGTEVRNYRLVYDGDQRWSRLEKVYECWSNRCKPATTFAYGGGTTFNATSAVVDSFGTANGRKYSFRTIALRFDANGDGREDFLHNPNLDPRNALVCDNDWALMIATGIKSDPYENVFAQLPVSNCTSNWSEVRAADLDADGKWEIYWSVGTGHASLTYEGNGNFTSKDSPLRVFQVAWDDDGDGRPTTTIPGTSKEIEVSFPIDTDSDGVLNPTLTGPYNGKMTSSGLYLGVQLLSVPLDKVESDTFVRIMKTSAPQCPAPPSCPWIAAGDEAIAAQKKCWDDLFSGRFASAERAFCEDYLAYNGARWMGGLKALDFNGDGQTDFIEWHPALGGTLNSTGTTELDIRAFTNTGRNQFVLASAPILAATGTSADMQLTAKAFSQSFVYDTDHDGRDELVAVMPNGSMIRVPIRPDVAGLGNGTLAYSLGNIGAVGDYDQFLVTDVDADGSPDVVYGDDTIHVLYQSHTSADRLIRVTDGLGRRDVIEYEAGTKAPYVAGTNATQAQNSQPIGVIPPVVTRHEVQPAVGPTVLAERFEYRNARLAFYGRGGLGFEQVQRSVDADGKTRLVEYTQYDVSTFLPIVGTFSAVGGSVHNLFPYAGRPHKRIREHFDIVSGFGAAAELVMLAETEVWNYAFGLSDRARPFVYLKSEEVAAKEHPNGAAERQVSKRTKDYSVDEYGAIEGVIETTYGPSNNVVETIQSTYGHDFGGSAPTGIWPRRLNTSIETTSEKGGETVTRKTNLDYYPDGNVKFDEDDSGNASLAKRIEYTYNNRGNVLTTTTSSGVSTSTTRKIYDPRGEFPETELNALGHQTTNAWYKGYGILAAQQDPNGLVTQTFIDGFGRPIRTIDPQGVVAETEYLVAMTTPDFLGGKTRLVEKHTSAAAPTSYSYFDSLGRKIGTETITQEGSLRTATGYDGLGRIWWETPRPFTSTTIPATLAYSYYDDLNRVTQKTYPNDAEQSGWSTIELEYGRPYEWPNNELGSETLGEGASLVRRMYPGGFEEFELLDVSGRKVALLDRAGATTSLRYGPFGTAREVQDAAGITYQTYYDGLGRPVGSTDPIRGNTTTSYSSGLGETVTVVTNAGTTARQNDLLGRVKTETRPEGTTTWTYDTGVGAVGQVVSVVGPGSELSPNGTIATFGYNSASSQAGSRCKLQSSTSTISGETFTTGYVYDALGRASSVSYPSAAGRPFAASFSYDQDGRLASVSDSNSPTLAKYYEVISRTGLGEIQSERMNGNLVTDYTYYPLLGTQKSIAHSLNGTQLKKTELEYYETGSVRAVGQWEGAVASSENSRYYVYDSADRLTETYSASLSGGTWTAGPLLQKVTLDGIGNTLYKSDVGTYTYGDTDNPYAATAAGANSYHYDNLGRQTWRGGSGITGGSQDIEYASFGQPTKITSGSLGTTRYAYNGAQERVMRKDDSGTTIYVGDLYRRSADASNPTKRTHVYSISAIGRLVGEVTIEEQTGAVVGSPEIRALRDDHLGSSVLSVRSDGDVRGTRYDTFGATTDPLASPTGIGFAGYGNEQSVGLLRMGVRLYDPRLGRVLSPDGKPNLKMGQDGINPYAYSYNRPTAFVDPSGYEGELWSVPNLYYYYQSSWPYGYGTTILTPPSFSSIYSSYAGLSGIVPGPEGDPFRLNATQYSYSQYAREWNAFRDGLNDFAVQGGGAPLIQRLLNGPGPTNGIVYPQVSNALNLDVFVLAGGADYSLERVLNAASNLLTILTTGLSMGQMEAAIAGVQSYIRGLTSRAVAAEAVGETSTALSTIRQTAAGEQFFHYGYAEQAANFGNGIRSGGYATTVPGLSGDAAQAGLSLPHATPPNAIYVVTPQPGTWIQVNPTAAGLFGQPGGLPEVRFLFGTSPGTVSIPIPIF